MFRDRADAGRRLGAMLGRYRDEHPIVVAVPRGGVPVGFEVARALGAPLEIVVVRKLGAPGEPELGIGAVADGGHPETVLNRDVIRLAGVPRAYLEREVERQLAEIQRRQTLYRQGREAADLRDCTVILVDDGIATGGSIRAALRSVRRAGARRVILAVPVAPPDTIEALHGEADEIVCVETPENLGAIGEFYLVFSQTGDAEVIRLLGEARAVGAATDRVETLHGGV